MADSNRQTDERGGQNPKEKAEKRKKEFFWRDDDSFKMKLE